MLGGWGARVGGVGVIEGRDLRERADRRYRQTDPPALC